MIERPDVSAAPAPVVTICDAPDPLDSGALAIRCVRPIPGAALHPRLQITIATPADFGAIYLTHSAAFALMATLADYFSDGSEDDPDDEAA